jgi:hypothetical protein
VCVCVCVSCDDTCIAVHMHVAISHELMAFDQDGQMLGFGCVLLHRHR